MNLHGNWIDLLILISLVFFLIEAWRVGFWLILLDFISFLISLLVSLKTYQFFSHQFQENFSLSHSLSNALGFLVAAFLTEGIVGSLLYILIKKLPLKYWKNPLNKILAFIPALGEGLILISFLLTLIISLPLPPKIKSDISDSKIGSYLVQKTSGLESKLSEIFGGVVEDSLTYLTVKPGSRDVIPITTAQKVLSVDEESEKAMFNLVNSERVKRGIGILIWSDNIRDVARGHASDMWERQYFGHVSPEGKDVGDRLNNAGIPYQFAGENLALAPTLSMAHTGLMNSEGHRENILEPKFKKVGIGVIDNGIYGKMFVQVFTD